MRADRRRFLQVLGGGLTVALPGAPSWAGREPDVHAAGDPAVPAAPPPAPPGSSDPAQDWMDPQVDESLWYGHPGASSVGPAIAIDLPQLRHEGRWNPRPGAMRVLARELRLRTRLEPVAEPSIVQAEDEALFSTPFLYVAGDGELPPFSPAGETALRRFMDLGGLVLFDAADGGTDPTFSRDVRALLARIAPASTVAPVGSDHVLFRSFYMVDAPMGRTRNHDHVLGLSQEGRLQAIIVLGDLGGALAETPDGLAAYPCQPGGAMQREWAIRFGVNILLYATCTDYKADRAHVETLLRARRWR